MANDIDRASEITELFIEVALKNSTVTIATLPDIGHCYNCSEDLTSHDKQRRFCDADCCADWEKRKAKK